MSWEAWGDDDSMRGPEGYVTDERAEEMFVGGLQAMREMLAQFVEAQGLETIAQSIRANWKPEWGKDPGRPEKVYADPWETP